MHINRLNFFSFLFEVFPGTEKLTFFSQIQYFLKTFDFFVQNRFQLFKTFKSIEFLRYRPQTADRSLNNLKNVSFTSVPV